MLTSFDQVFIISSIIGACIIIAIVICYIIYLHVEDRRMEETRCHCIELTKLNAELKSPYLKKMMTEEIIREVQKIRSELNSVFDKLENVEIE